MCKRLILANFLLIAISITCAAQGVTIESSVLIKGDGRVFVGPDPADFSGLVKLLSEPSVIEELVLSETQQDSIAKMLESSNKRLAMATKELMNLTSRDRADLLAPIRDEESKRLATELDEILTPSQRKRIPQIAYRVELAQVGCIAETEAVPRNVC